MAHPSLSQLIEFNKNGPHCGHTIFVRWDYIPASRAVSLCNGLYCTMPGCATASRLEELPQGDRGYVFQNVAIAFIILETLAVALRFYARQQVVAPMGIDDIFVTIALVSNLALCGISLGKLGLRIHFFLVPTRSSNGPRWTYRTAHALGLCDASCSHSPLLKAADTVHSHAIIRKRLREACYSLSISANSPRGAI